MDSMFSMAAIAFWALCAAGLLLALFTVVLLVQNRRINALAARHADYAAALLRQGQGAAVFAQDTAEALEAVKNLELRLTEAENSIRRVAALAGDAGLAARVSQLELKLDADDAAANAPGTLNSRLESCQAKIAQLEKSLTDAAAAQNAARRQLAADWLRIMGSPRPGDTRTALDRIALLEQLMMNNLNAAERPDRLPRRPVTVRLETLETLLAGSEDILAAQSHPGGVLLQLETLKQEVAKLKWALGK